MKKEKRERNDYSTHRGINVVLLRKHHCIFCKGKSCPINFLKMHKGTFGKASHEKL